MPFGKSLKTTTLKLVYYAVESFSQRPGFDNEKMNDFCISHNNLQFCPAYDGGDNPYSHGRCAYITGERNVSLWIRRWLKN